MCGRYTIHELALIRATLGIDVAVIHEFEEYEARVDPNSLYNIAPSQACPVVRLNKEDKPSLGLVKWGFIPFFTKEKPLRQPPINAKAETVATSGMFREGYKRRRCLIPADGFYEPRGPKTLEYRPWYYFQKYDSSLFTFGGVWDRWKKPDGETIDTFAIITTKPNETVGEIHDRAPLIIDEKDRSRWLTRDIDVADLLHPFADDLLEFWPVSDGAKNPRAKGPELIEQVDGA